MPAKEMSKAILVDTSGWGNLADATQPFHKDALRFYLSAQREGYKLVTTNYILVELVALMTSPLRVQREKIVAFINAIRRSGAVEIVYIDAELDAQAWQLLASRIDKAWSLTDCASFVVMQLLGLDRALTSDRHFEQAGFVRLLK